MSDLDDLKDDLIVASNLLLWEIGDIWGHVGVRVPERQEFMVKFMRSPLDENIDPNDILTYDLKGNKVGGKRETPNELPIYTRIFKERADVNSIVHCHPPMVVALSIAGQQIMPIHLQSFRFGNSVPVLGKPAMIVNDEEGDELAQTLGPDVAVVIRGHGAVTVGKTIPQACLNMMYLERTAKIQAIAGLYGKIDPVSSEYIELQRARLKHEGGGGGGVYEWKYYKERVKKGEKWTRGWT